VAFADDPAEIQTPSAGDSVGGDPIAEYLPQRRRLFPDGADTVYSLRVARAGNLLVVIEDTGPDKRGISNANVTMTVAVRRALEGSDMVAPPWCPDLMC
jgi:hypothetical protein